MLEPTLGVTQSSVPAGVIDLGLGHPGNDLLPLAQLAQAAAHRFAQSDPSFLQYGSEAGSVPLRAALAAFLQRAGGYAVDAESLFITNGVSQALEQICTLFTRPGDLVLVEAPTYFLALRIFATDMNRELIQRARDGSYPASIVDSITPARLKDHFIATEDGYHVRTHINRMIVWAEHNLIDHPPFSGLSLISCRNVLIYFQPKLQERIRALFQFALRAEGILFLGTSEAIPDVSGIFTVVDSKQKIYRRSAGAARQWMPSSPCR